MAPMDFKQHVLKLTQKGVKLLKAKTKIADDLLEVPPQQDMGDFALPCFFLAKELKKNPARISAELAKVIPLEKPVKKVEVKGPYLNFFVYPEAKAEHTLKQIQKEQEKYGCGKEKGIEKGKRKGKKKTIMLEYPSPNTNKPLHLGHMRNMLLGESIGKTLVFLNHKLIRANLNNDRGVHICKSMLAYQKWGKKESPSKANLKPDHLVGKYYVIFNQKAKKNPKLEQEAQDMLVRWEKGDKEIVQLWKLMNAWAYQGFEETYNKLGLFFDKYYYESDFYKKGKKLIMDGVKKKVFHKDDDGAIVFYLDKEKKEKKVVLRPDGTSIYITQDLYLAKKKFEDYKLDESLYIVATEQNFHFVVLFKILKALKYKWANKCQHLRYGMVHLPEGRMKSREGTVVDADDLIQNMIDLSKVEVRKRWNDLPKEEVEKRAHLIGLGSLKFFMLKFDHTKDMVFNPKESISFEGETGPYVQYAHARICSLKKKYDEKFNTNTSEGKLPLKIEYNMLTDAHEQKIIALLNKFPVVVEEAGAKRAVYLIARYLLELSQAFNEFYHSCQIINEKQNVREARLVLVDGARVVLENGLKLLGIHAPEEM